MENGYAHKVRLSTMDPDGKYRFDEELARAYSSRSHGRAIYSTEGRYSLFVDVEIPLQSLLQNLLLIDQVSQSMLDSDRTSSRNPLAQGLHPAKGTSFLMHRIPLSQRCESREFVKTKSIKSTPNSGCQF